jgi:hypothetical protein
VTSSFPPLPLSLSHPSPSFFPLPSSSPPYPTAPPTAASSVKQLAAALAASALLLASSPAADAKVVLAKGAPKKVFQGAESSAPRDRSSASSSTPKAKKASGPAFGSGATPSIGAGSIGTLALPLSLLGIAGAAAAASAADSGFGEFIDGASLRDCNNYAGYEPALKSESGPPTRAAGGAAPKKALKKRK